MTATYELQSPDGVNKLLEQIKAGFSGRLRVTVTTLPPSGDGDSPEDDEDYIDYLVHHPVGSFIPLTREEANDRRL